MITIYRFLLFILIWRCLDVLFYDSIKSTKVHSNP